MNSAEIMEIENQRPRSLQISKSFSRATTSDSIVCPRLDRASSLQDGTPSSFFEENREWESDAFERKPDDDEFKADFEIPEKLPDDFDKLPIELVSLSDHFIESLSAKVHHSPPSIEKLSGLFQDFYEVAVNHINTHVSTISSLQNRQRTSNSSLSSTIVSTASKFKSKSTSTDSFSQTKSKLEKECLDQQMLTTEEIADRRGARKMLEFKRKAMEEAVERRVCETTYDRIWRHRSTHDEEQDEKLRSRTAALSLVGIGLKDLGVDLGVEDNNDPDLNQRREREVSEWLAEARKELCAMNDLKYPLGKIQHLKMAHKAIVETLSRFHPSSSADEVMPMLIYTLITSRPEGINIMSNLCFIQRFRNASKIDGEAAYCLTNLEAAISFLETVDLASLRADEALSGPPKSSSRMSTPSPEIFDPLINPLTPSTSVSVVESTHNSPFPEIVKQNSSSVRPRADSQPQSHRLSDLFSSPVSLGTASDVVLSSADQGLESIGNSIGDSYKYLLGKLKGRQEDEVENKNEIPSKTPEDTQISAVNSCEDVSSNVRTSSFRTPENNQRTRADSGSRIEERIISMISGRKSSRDKSSDSNKRVSFAEEASSGKSPSPLQIVPSSNPALVESMRNLGNSLNPMNRIPGIGMMRAFGRSTPPATPQIPPSLSLPTENSLDVAITNLGPAFPDFTTTLPSKESTKIVPPIMKFLELQSAGDLKLNEVKDLLRDYKRLAGVLKELGVV